VSSVKRLKIGWLQAWVVAALVSCISAGLCIMVFCGGKDAQAGQALPGGGAVASASATSASRAGVSATVSPTLTPAPSASVKWTPTAQEAKKRAEALKMQAPVRPEEIAQNTDEGAVATAKYAIELYNYTFATGNVDEYKALCISDRKSCVKVPVDALKMHQNGGWVDPIQVTFVSGWVRKDVTKNVVVQLWFYRNASQEHSGQGELQNISAGKFASLVTLKFDGVEWKVQEIYVEEKH
jgi:lipoprotein